MSATSPLITAAELLTRIGAPDVRIADTRWFLADGAKGRRDYDLGHIPGAVFVDLETELVTHDGPGRHPLPSPAEFAARMGARGFGDGTEIVAYDDAGGTTAARLWWMLDRLGHRRVRVLDGGIRAWIAAGGTLSTDVPEWPATSLTVPWDGRDWPTRIERDELVRRLGTVTIVDVRVAERYRGDMEPIDPVAGHIPTAINGPAAEHLEEDGRFRDPAALRERFSAMGAVDDAAAGRFVAQCGSGVTASHLALAMRVAGLADPLLYGGSYSDWSRSGMPVVTGTEPGEIPAGLRGSA